MQLKKMKWLILINWKASVSRPSFFVIFAMIILFTLVFDILILVFLKQDSMDYEAARTLNIVKLSLVLILYGLCITYFYYFNYRVQHEQGILDIDKRFLLKLPQIYLMRFMIILVTIFSLLLVQFFVSSMFYIGIGASNNSVKNLAHSYFISVYLFVFLGMIIFLAIACLMIFIRGHVWPILISLLAMILIVLTPFYSFVYDILTASPGQHQQSVPEEAKGEEISPNNSEEFNWKIKYANYRLGKGYDTYRFFKENNYLDEVVNSYFDYVSAAKDIAVIDDPSRYENPLVHRSNALTLGLLIPFSRVDDDSVKHNDVNQGNIILSLAKDIILHSKKNLGCEYENTYFTFGFNEIRELDYKYSSDCIISKQFSILANNTQNNKFKSIYELLRDTSHNFEKIVFNSRYLTNLTGFKFEINYKKSPYSKLFGNYPVKDEKGNTVNLLAIYDNFMILSTIAYLFEEIRNMINLDASALEYFYATNNNQYIDFTTWIQNSLWSPMGLYHKLLLGGYSDYITDIQSSDSVTWSPPSNAFIYNINDETKLELYNYYHKLFDSLPSGEIIENFNQKYLTFNNLKKSLYEILEIRPKKLDYILQIQVAIIIFLFMLSSICSYYIFKKTVLI